MRKYNNSNDNDHLNNLKLVVQFEFTGDLIKMWKQKNDLLKN